MRIKSILLSTITMGALFASAMADEAFPNQPVRIIVPFAAGGQTDVMARLLANAMGADLGQTVIVENIGGAGGTIGASNVAQSDADGYTLLFGTVGTQVVNQFTMSDISYDSKADFTPVAKVATATAVIVANPEFEASTIAELIALAKAKPGEVMYTTPGVGTSGHLAMELIEYTAGIDMVAIPYQGGAPATTDLIAGHVMLGVDGLPGQLTQISSGSLKALGTSGAERDPAAPDVPAISETLPGFEATAWYALLGPKSLPEDIATKLNAATNAALQNPDLIKKYQDMGISVAGGTATDLATFIDAETVKWKQVVESAGISAE